MLSSKCLRVKYTESAKLGGVLCLGYIIPFPISIWLVYLIVDCMLAEVRNSTTGKAGKGISVGVGGPITHVLG